jgi:putative flippase GtrA
MKLVRRLGKFAAVGAMGMAVQLGTLAQLNRAFPGHYLFASAAALELTLLHNFVWHIRYTWRDRQNDTPWLDSLVKFHLSNGAVSIGGNLALMWVLVQHAHLPVVFANLIAIACCSLANFALGDHWTFARAHPATGASRSACAQTMLAAGLMLALYASGQAQSAPVLRDPYAGGLGTDCAYENLFLGPAGGSNQSPTFTGGITIGQYFARTMGTGIVASPQFELGLVGPLRGGHPVDGLVSVDAMLANKLAHRHAYPFATVGYTRMFATGNAVNFGFGVDFGKDEFKRIIRLEVRDYYLFTGPQQHVVGLRIGFGKFIAD